jgi:hypothetical membrane protein
VQLFIAQVVVQSAWTKPFSLTRNFISDLGNTTCGAYPPGSGNDVCSPWHAAMNASFIVIGLTTVLGAVWVRCGFRPGKRRDAGLALIALGGLGFVLVGLFPENVSLGPHKVGAALQFVCGNLGLVTLGAAMLGRPRLATPRWHATAACSIALGVAGLIATALFVSGRDLGAGIGGMERIAAYPLPIGSILLGLCLVRDRAGRPRMEIS